jgi:hypothetical protein
MAAVFWVSVSLNALPSSPRSILSDQPPWRNGSPTPGASTTPSSEMNSVMISFPMVVSFVGRPEAAC